MTSPATLAALAAADWHVQNAWFRWPPGYQDEVLTVRWNDATYFMMRFRGGPDAMLRRMAAVLPGIDPFGWWWWPMDDGSIRVVFRDEKDAKDFANHFFGCLPPPNRLVSLDEIKEAIEDGWAGIERS